MKNLFITYPLALIAKEKGFNESCIALIDLNNRKHLLNISDNETLIFDQEVTKYNGVPCVPCPMYQQITDWFREKKSIHIEIELEDNSRNFNYSICIVDSRVSNREHNDQDMIDQAKRHYIKFETSNYYGALNKAIDEAFKLI